MKLWILMGLSLTALAGPAQDFCGSELMASFAVMGAEREENQKEPFLKAHLSNVLETLQLKGDVFRSAAALPYEQYLETLQQYLSALEAPIQKGKMNSAIFDRMGKLVEAQTGSLETKEKLLRKLGESDLVSLSRLVEVMETIPEGSRTYYQTLLPNACGADGLGRGGIAFHLNEKRVFAFCPGALLTAMVEKAEDGYHWAQEIDLTALWFTAFHELGHVLGADSSSEFRALYNPLIRCLSAKTSPIPVRYQDEVIADFWGAAGLSALLSDDSLSEEQKIKWVTRNLAPFRQGSMFSPHHLPFGARLQVVQLEVCRQLEKRPLKSQDCRLELGTPEN